MSKHHWTVITREEWPAIQAKGQDTPLIVFSKDTDLGERAARRWAELICLWMNEQMRLGVSTAKERHCDAMLLLRLKQAERELKKLNLENQSLSGKMIKSQQAARRAASELRHAQQ